MKLNAQGVGIRIKQARIAKGWTQTDLAQALKVQRSAVGRWETGLSVPRNIPHIARTLGQSAEWLLEKGDEILAPTDSPEIKQLSREIRKLQNKLSKTSAPTPAAAAAPTKSTSQKREPNYKDPVVLSDVLAAWNSASEESRLMVALLLTKNWAYKLKLWNRDVAVSDEVLKI